MSARINLLPKKDLKDTLMGKLLAFSLTYGRYIIVCTQLIVLLAFFSRFKLDRELSDLQDSIEQKNAIVESLQPFESEVREIQERINQIKVLKENHDEIRSSILTLKKVLPEGNTATNITISGGKISIKGLSRDEQSFADLLERAKKLKGILAVEFGGIGKDKDSDMITFDLSYMIENRDNVQDN